MSDFKLTRDEQIRIAVLTNAVAYYHNSDSVTHEHFSETIDDFESYIRGTGKVVEKEEPRTFVIAWKAEACHRLFAFANGLFPNGKKVVLVTPQNLYRLKGVRFQEGDSVLWDLTNLTEHFIWEVQSILDIPESMWGAPYQKTSSDEV
jgi:hypothetical protein